MTKLKVIGGIILTFIVVYGLIKLFSWLLVSMVYILATMSVALVLGLIIWIIVLKMKLNRKQ